MKKMSSNYYTGITDHQLERDPQSNMLLRPSAAESFKKLKKRASLKGIDLTIVSSFRSFEQQLKIWNEKAQGKRSLLDDQGNALEYSTLSDEEILFSILRWSALPGLSRHHWGTDLDVIDSRPLVNNEGYKVQLIPQEYERGAIFSALGEFLNSAELTECDFYRPYEKDLGGVSPEPWHLSFAKGALEQEKLLSIDLFEKWLNSENLKEMSLLEQVKEKKKYIFENYIINTQANPIA
jgi:LAS superfamily LD-carboxypeptidase LdcB